MHFTHDINHDFYLLMLVLQGRNHYRNCIILVDPELFSPCGSCSNGFFDEINVARFLNIRKTFNHEISEEETPSTVKFTFGGFLKEVACYIISKEPQPVPEPLQNFYPELVPHKNNAAKQY
jgi:hypothetical protein